MSEDLSLLIYRLSEECQGLVYNTGKDFRGCLRWHGDTPQQIETNHTGPFNSQSEAIKAVTAEFIARINVSTTQPGA
jgi:hypothetical protein